VSDFLPDLHRTYLRFFLDSNCLNARGKLPAVSRLEAWGRDGVIELMLPQGTFEEATREPWRSKSREYIFTMDHADTPDERARLRKIEQVIFPGGAQGSAATDVRIVFNADKYGAILVTNDGASKNQPGGILGARDALAALNIRVMRPEEACAQVEERLELNARIERLRRQG
jgi:hypothetical protein